MSDDRPTPPDPPADSPAEDPSEASTVSIPPPESSPRQIGPYKILQKLGEGGMGVVYLAQQERPLRRRVALKLIKLGMDTQEVLARFESERQALAIMNHPNIAKVYDAGSTEQGRPFFVMEYVQGIPITEYCDKHQLTNKERLQLFIPVCQAIHHAHQKAVIHRDVKPSNILVAVEDGYPVPKVIDFGVAKATSQRLTERTLFTQHGTLIGTPEYMSPEQAEMTNLDIDITTDVYSLGVVLYELLVGALPFDSQALREAGYDEMRRIIREEDPPKPSTRMSTLGPDSGDAAKRRRTSPAVLQKTLRDDLDWITMKALEKDRVRRYRSPIELADDIARYLRTEPVVAGPPGAPYRLAKFAKRHRKGIVLSAVIAVVLATYGVTITASRLDRIRATLAMQKEDVRAFLAWIATDEGSNPDTRDEHFEKTLGGVCDRIRSGDSSDLDHAAFVNAYLTADFEGRPLITSDDQSLDFSICAQGRWASLANELGLYLVPHLQLDGKDIMAPRCPEGCLHWIPDWSGRSCIAGHIRSPFSPGPHRIDGYLEVQIVQLSSSDFDHWPVDATPDRYRAIPETFVTVPVPKLEFTSVHAYPSNYPPRIVDDAEAARIESGFHLARVERIYGSSNNKARLVIEASFPAPKITIACELLIRPEKADWQESIEVVAGWSGISHRSRSGSEDEPEVEADTYRDASDERRHLLRIELPMMAASLRWIDSGTIVHIELVASESVARRSATVSEYLDLEIHRSTALTESVPGNPG